MERFVNAIRAALAAETGLPADQVRIETPRDPELGDFAFPCFPLAKLLKKGPPQIAGELAPRVEERLEGITVAPTGPYLNFRVERETLARTVLSRVLEEDARFGASKEGAGRTIVLDYSSPNIAKPMSVGHLRSTVIGAAIQRLHDTLGYETVSINHLGDWGSQFGKLVAAVDRWGGEVDLEDDPIPALLDLYVRYHEEEESDPSLQEAARAAFQELESGAPGHVRETWEKLTRLSLAEFEKTYRRLGVRFDEVQGESFYESRLEPTIQRIVDAGVTEESDGALVVSLSEFDENLPPSLLRKTDGTTLYATRDLAAAFYRWDRYAFDRCLYVVGADQRLHFQQLKLVLRRMGLDWEPRIEHIDFGMMRLPEGKISTRSGRVVFLSDVLDRAVEEAKRIIDEKNPEIAKRDEIAEQVGVGAIIFADLKRERVRDVDFVWEEVLSFEGETGPYVQYTHARLCSIERKVADAGEGAAEPSWSVLQDAAPLILRLGRYPGQLSSAAQNAEPSELSNYLLALCREINAWYAKSRVLGEAPEVTAARLALVRAARVVLRNGLEILGLHAPEEM